jgi:hypothetical protein
MDHSSSALEMDGSSSSAAMDINQFNKDIVQLRQLSISHIERELQDLQHSIDHGIDEVMSQLLEERDDLKRDFERTRDSITVASTNDIDHLQNRYRKQNRTLAQQKELLTADHIDQEIEEIIALLSSNLRSIKRNIEIRANETSVQLNNAEERYEVEQASIESRAAEYRVAIKDEVCQQLAQLQRQLVRERQILSLEEACCYDSNINTSIDHLSPQSPSRSSMPPMAPLVEDSENDDDYADEEEEEEGGDGRTRLPLVGNNNNRLLLQFPSDEKVSITPAEGGYSESDSDSDE